MQDYFTVSQWEVNADLHWEYILFTNKYNKKTNQKIKSVKYGLKFTDEFR